MNRESLISSPVDAHAPATPRSAFSIVPWRRDFLAGLVDCLLDRLPEARSTGDLSSCLIVFPHRRPRRYLQDRLARDPRLPKPCRPPAIISAAECFARLRAALVAQDILSPATTIGALDQVALLHECLLDLQKDSSGLLGQLSEHLPLRTPHLFFPWGLRLAALLEECLQHNATPQNILFVQDQVQEFAAALLEELADIHERYTTALDSNGVTTAGYDAATVAAYAVDAARSLEGKTVFLAGFSHLTGTQDALYRTLWESGQAHIALHCDPRLAEGNAAQAHWSCTELRRWIKDWDASTTLLDPLPATDEKELSQTDGPKLFFFEGFDLHSQLDALGRALHAQAAADGQGLADTAVVLPATGLLMPTLHNLPREILHDGVNVSMGYPLDRSTLAQLVETLVRLQESSPQPGLYHWRECIDLIRHPYLKMLETADGRPLRPVLHELETACRTAGKFLDPRSLAPAAVAQCSLDTDQEPVQGFLDLVLHRCLTTWETLPTLAALADALETICTLLASHGAALWQRFPVDAECLHRLLYSVIPALRQSRLSPLPFPHEALFAILRDLVQNERVPFEAEPLTGLQILGFLETRLLSFKHLYVLDATDANLPGGATHDALMPDSLRSILDLPDRHKRDRIAAYHFHRLVRGAKNVTLLYQASTQGTGLLEQKSVRSRFVEELLWEEEKRQGRLLEPGDPILHAVTYPIRPIPRDHRSIRKTNAVRTRLEAFFDRPLAPSALDRYLHCPASFFYQYVAKLAALDEIPEDGDPAAIGTLIHKILKEYLSPYLNRPISANSLDAALLQESFAVALRQSELFDQMPYDQRLLLEKTGRYRLGRFVANFPDTTVLGLEEFCEASITVRGRSIRLAGRLDRIDKRAEGQVILDYKTGVIPKPWAKFWEDSTLWSQLEEQLERPATDSAPADESDAVLALLAQRVQSVQLPCYLQLYRGRGERSATQAAFVALREEGEEIGLFHNKMAPEQREVAIEKNIPLLLEFILDHMLTSPNFTPRPERHCEWCTYRYACEE